MVSSARALLPATAAAALGVVVAAAVGAIAFPLPASLYELIIEHKAKDIDAHYPVQQVHLAHVNPATMAVQYVTRRYSSTDGLVEFGLSEQELNFSTQAANSTYTDGGFQGWIWNAVLENLSPATRYYYKIGNVSEVFTFRTAPEVGGVYPESNQLTIGFIGDEGVQNSELTIANMNREVKDKRSMDIVIHVGDIGYANNYPVPNAAVWDVYVHSKQTQAAHVPYMTCPGNHESQFDFAGYRNRFSHMPTNASGSGSPFWYSFDYGPVHFLSYSCEQTFEPGSEQYNFIVHDLEVANQNRNKTPWIVAYTHRPAYCTSWIDTVFDPRCTTEAAKYNGWMEENFNKFGLDLHISGHNHQYERSFPVRNQTVVGSTRELHDFVDPGAPIYIVNGAAGNIEFIDPTTRWIDIPWRAKSIPGVFGYGRLHATPAKLEWQFAEDLGAIALDNFSISKSRTSQGDSELASAF